MVVNADSDCIIRDGRERRQRLYHTWWSRTPTATVSYVMVANAYSDCIIRDGRERRQRLYHTWCLRTPTATVWYVMLRTPKATVSHVTFANADSNCVIRDGCEHRKRLYHTWWSRMPIMTVSHVMFANADSNCVIRDGCEHRKRLSYVMVANTDTITRDVCERRQQLCDTWWLRTPTTTAWWLRTPKATVSHVMVANGDSNCVIRDGCERTCGHYRRPRLKMTYSFRYMVTTYKQQLKIVLMVPKGALGRKITPFRTAPRVWLLQVGDLAYEQWSLNPIKYQAWGTPPPFPNLADVPYVLYRSKCW